MLLNEKFSSQSVDLEIVNGVLIVAYKVGVPITLEIAKNSVKERIEFTAGRSYPVLIRDYGISVIEKEARSYFASTESTNGISAAAFVLKSIFSVFLGNFFIKIYPPNIPVKIFGGEEDAIKWLRQFTNNS